MSTNSSPPIRATVSLWRTLFVSRCATARSKRSPNSCPWVSFTSLILSMSMNRTAKAVPDRLARARSWCSRSTIRKRFGRSVSVSWVARCWRATSVWRISVISRVIPTRPMTGPGSSWSGSLDASVPVGLAVLHLAALDHADDGTVHVHDPDVVQPGSVAKGLSEQIDVRLADQLCRIREAKATGHHAADAQQTALAILEVDAFRRGLHQGVEEELIAQDLRRPFGGCRRPARVCRADSPGRVGLRGHATRPIPRLSRYPRRSAGSRSRARSGAGRRSSPDVRRRLRDLRRVTDRASRTPGAVQGCGADSRTRHPHRPRRTPHPVPARPSPRGTPR